MTCLDSQKNLFLSFSELKKEQKFNVFGIKGTLKTFVRLQTMNYPNIESFEKQKVPWLVGTKQKNFKHVFSQ